MIFIQDFGCDQHLWRLVVPAFEGRYRVVLLDLAGAGGSDLTACDPARYATLAAHAQDALDVVHALDLHNAVLVGLSVGAMISVLAAIREPKRFARLVAPSPRFYEHAPCGYCSCLPDGTLVKLNQTLLGFLGYMRQEVVACPTLPQRLTVGGRLHYETHCAPLLLLLQGQVREVSHSLRRHDGSALPVLLNAVLRCRCSGCSARACTACSPTCSATP